MLLKIVSHRSNQNLLSHLYKGSVLFDADKLFGYSNSFIKDREFQQLRFLTRSEIKFKFPQNFKPNEDEDDIVDKNVLQSHNDPDVFGTLSRIQTTADEDDGDIQDEEYSRNIPFRSDQLPLKRYAQMIEKHIKNKCLKDAIDILEVRMLKTDRVKPDNYIYDLLIMECGRLGYAKKAFQLYNRMKQRDLIATGPTFAALFNACANSIHPNEGLKLATNLRKILIQKEYDASEIIYNTMIKAFGRCGDIKTAFQLVDEMKEKKKQLRVDTLNHLLQSCCSDKEHGFRNALLVWHSIYRKKLNPDLHSFNLLLRCTRDCQMGELDVIRIVIARILMRSQDHVKIKTGFDNRLLIESKPQQSINTNENMELEKVDDQLLDDENKSTDSCDQMPNFISKLPHLGSLVELNDVKTCEDRLFLLGGMDSVISEMEALHVRPDVKTFTQLLDLIPSTRDAETQLIEKMRYVRVRADTDFFNVLMKRRIYRQDHEGAKAVLTMMKKVDLQPDIATYGLMAMLCINCEQAQEYRQSLKNKNIRPNIEILGALLKNACYFKDYNYVSFVLEYCLAEGIQPSAKFTRIIGLFKNKCYRAMESNENMDKNETKKYNQFYRTYKNWKAQTGLHSNAKVVEEHPWKQFKTPQQGGIEEVKGPYIRTLWKRRHVLKKLNPTYLQRIHDEKDSQNSEIEDETKKLD